MSRKLAVVLVVAALSVAFAVVSFLVYLARGRGPLLRAKLRLGALLLSLGAVAVTGACDDEGDRTCYAPTPTNNFVIVDPAQQGDGVTVDLAGPAVLLCRIDWRQGELFSWRIADESLLEIERGDIEPADGDWDSPSESFEIRLAPLLLDEGTYWLWLYNTNADNQPANPYGNVSVKLYVVDSGA